MGWALISTSQVYEGDALSLLNVYRAYRRKARRGGACGPWCHKHKLNERALQRVAQVRSQLERHTRRFGIASESAHANPSLGGITGTDAIRRALVRGLFANAAEHTGRGHYTAVRRGAALVVHPNSVLFKAPPAWVVFHETVHTDKEFMLGATKVEREWLTDLAPHFYALEQRAPAPKRGLATTFVDDLKRQRTTGEAPQPQDLPASAHADAEDAHEAATPPRET